jgi:Tfp pilus assembly protein PilN
MINLLPPATKEQIRFAKYNRVALRYLELVAAVVVVIVIIFASALDSLDHQVTKVTADLVQKQATIATYNQDKATAADAANRINAIKAIEASQTRFSQLLYDLAAVLPKGVSINGIALTGDASKPVVVSVDGTSYDQILAFRNSIVTSPRISGADLQNIASAPGGYQANVVLGFRPGQAK